MCSSDLEAMNSVLLVALVSCPPVAAYPDADPAHGGTSHQGRHRLFGWLRGRHHDKKYPSAGNGHAGGNWPPVAAAPAVWPGTLEAATLGPAPAVVPTPACPCAGNGHAGSSWPPVAAAPAPPVIPPPATAGPVPRLVPRPQPVTTGAEPPRD